MSDNLPWKLQYAVDVGDVAMVEAVLQKDPSLLQAGAGSARSRWLHRAAEKGQAEVIRCLVGKGLNVDERDGDDHFPLWLAFVAAESFEQMRRASPDYSRLAA